MIFIVCIEKHVSDDVKHCYQTDIAILQICENKLMTPDEEGRTATAAPFSRVTGMRSTKTRMSYPQLPQINNTVQQNAIN